MEHVLSGVLFMCVGISAPALLIGVIWLLAKGSSITKKKKSYDDEMAVYDEQY